MSNTYYTFESWTKALSCVSKEDQRYAICKEVLDNLNINKVYLDPKLSLTKFCSIVGTNTTYLSNAVNRCFGCNLKYLINWYRVQYAKSLVLGTPGKMRGLPSACGFASKSAFYASFKKIEGLTPIQYVTKESGSGNDRKEEQETNEYAYSCAETQTVSISKR